MPSFGSPKGKFAKIKVYRLSHAHKKLSLAHEKISRVQEKLYI